MSTRAVQTPARVRARKLRRTILFVSFACTLAYLAAAYWCYVRPWPRITRAAPSQSLQHAPQDSLRFVSCNIDRNRRRQQVIEQIRGLLPDFVMLQEVPGSDIESIAESFEMKYHFASENRPDSWDVLLSRYPLCDAETIRSPDGGAPGCLAMAEVGNKRFMIASVHLSATYEIGLGHLKTTNDRRFAEMKALIDVWEKSGKPPIIIGGDFNQLSTGQNYSLMIQHFTDALAQFGATEETFRGGIVSSRIDYFLTSPQWELADGKVVPVQISDHQPILLITGSGPGSVSKPVK